MPVMSERKCLKDVTKKCPFSPFNGVIPCQLASQSEKFMRDLPTEFQEVLHEMGDSPDPIVIDLLKRFRQKFVKENDIDLRRCRS